MKIETILNAMVLAQIQITSMLEQPLGHVRYADDLYRLQRQRTAFRARILRMDAENIEQLAQAEIQERNLNKRIAELEKYIEDHNYKTILDYLENFMLSEEIT